MQFSAAEASFTCATWTRVSLVNRPCWRGVDILSNSPGAMTYIDKCARGVLAYRDKYVPGAVAYRDKFTTGAVAYRDKCAPGAVAYRDKSVGGQLI